MLYFAYGSNLNHAQMKRRCKDSEYIKNFYLKNYKLSFCLGTRPDGVANVVEKSGSSVPGALWKISPNDEKQLDRYEGYPRVYDKKFFKIINKKVLFYIMEGKCKYKRPERSYVKKMSKGYKDCNLDINYLKGRLIYYSRNYRI